MHVDWVHFSPWSALAGGSVIGVAAGFFFLLLGRIAGVSGILAGLLPPRSGDVGWRIAFALGLFAAPLLVAVFRTPAPPAFNASGELLIVAGLLVGFGSRLGSGCTSGHGVCGLSRLSVRSLVATATFMASGVATVFILRHVAS
jgi:uncharacterized membrane protein YedE/YeeE